MGRLTKDPEVRYGANNLCVARYNLAIDRRVKKDGQSTADYIRCVGFGKNGEFAEKYLKKGTKIAIVGRIQTGSYDKDGQKVFTTDVVVEEHYFAESKRASDQSSPAATSTDLDGFMDIPDDISEELPFN